MEGLVVEMVTFEGHCFAWQAAVVKFGRSRRQFEFGRIEEVIETIEGRLRKVDARSKDIAERVTGRWSVSLRVRN